MPRQTAGNQMPQYIQIACEDDALQFLNNSLHNSFADNRVQVSFKDWPNLEFDISGDDYNSSLKTSQLRALIKVQETIYYQYGLLTNRDPKTLSNSEREKLELTIHVGKGSSDVLLVLTNLFNNLLTNNLPRMDIITGAVLLSAIYGSVKVANRYFDLMVYKEDEQHRLLDILKALAQQNKVYERLTESAIRALETLARSAPDSKEIRINKTPTSHIRKIKLPVPERSSPSSIFSKGRQYEVQCKLVGLKNENRGWREYRFSDLEFSEILVWRIKDSFVSKSLDHRLRMALSSQTYFPIRFQAQKEFPKGWEILLIDIFGKKVRSFINIK
jgi:hypothetical protein